MKDCVINNLMQTEGFDHFLITRFNLRVKEYGTTTKHGAPLLTDSWMDHRFSLFGNFCFPSVRHQISTDFFWLVFFDTTTPEKYRRHIHLLESQCSNFCPVFLDGHDHFAENLKIEIRKRRDPAKEYIITSRLDNDDALNLKYIKTVQSLFNHQKSCVVDFPEGYSLSIEGKFRLGKMTMLSNPFVSLIETYEKLDTVMLRSHADWYAHPDIIQIRGARLWLQIIHDQNKINAYQGNFLVDPTLLRNEFGIAEQIIQSYTKGKSDDLFFYNLFVAPARVIYQWMVATKIKLKKKLK